MEILKDIVSKHLEQAAIEQLASEYQQKGYEVVQEPRVGDLRADLMVRREDEVIVFEIKVGEWTDEKRALVRRMRNEAVHRLGAKFKLVLVNLPKEPDIVVENLEFTLSELLEEHFVNEFSSLATHHWIDEVTDIEFEELSIRERELEAVGSAMVTLRLQYGSDSDIRRGDGILSMDSFPFRFHVLLDRNLRLQEVLSLELDAPEDAELGVSPD